MKKRTQCKLVIISIRAEIIRLVRVKAYSAYDSARLNGWGATSDGIRVLTDWIGFDPVPIVGTPLYPLGLFRVFYRGKPSGYKKKFCTFIIPNCSSRVDKSAYFCTKQTIPDIPCSRLWFWPFLQYRCWTTVCHDYPQSMTLSERERMRKSGDWPMIEKRIGFRCVSMTWCLNVSGCRLPIENVSSDNVTSAIPSDRISR